MVRTGSALAHGSGEFFEPKGASSRGRSLPVGRFRASRLPPGSCLAYALAPVVAVVAMATPAADRDGDDAGLRSNRHP